MSRLRFYALALAGAGITLSLLLALRGPRALRAEQAPRSAPRAGALRPGGPVHALASLQSTARRPLHEAREPALEAALAAVAQQAREQARSALGRRSGPIEIAVCVVDGASGRVLAALEADEALRPASNLKLVTSAAALALLGPAHEFETRAEAGGPLANGLLDGPLVLRAGADPLYEQAAQEDISSGRVETRLADFARELRARGLERVRGGLLLDEGSYEAAGPAPGWPAADQHWTASCALSSGFTLNAGILVAHARAPRGGAPAEVQLHPAPCGLPTSLRVAGVGGARNDVRVGASAARGVEVKGELGSGLGARRYEFAHPDPSLLFASVLLDQLQRAGIAVEGGWKRTRGAPAGTWLASLRSPLLACLVPINTHSVNSVADQVFYELGARAAGAGSRSGGRAALAIALRQLGVPATGLVAVDGSGLSRDNRVSARQIAALLWSVAQSPPALREAFFGSLAVGGSTGTLSDRFRALDARVRAKTGFIGGTSSLSGELANADGSRSLLFAILVNYPKADGLNSSCFKPMQDRMVERLARELP